MLRSAIDRFRLPEEILDWDIAGVVEMGVSAETGKILGKDMTVSSLLREGHEAVLLASGGWDSRLSRGPSGEIESPIPGTLLLIDFMTHIRRADNAIDLPADVVIYGGGALALEAARACRKKGAQKVTVVFRETDTDVSVDESLLQDLGGENIDVLFQTGITQLSGENDRLSEVGIIDLQSRKTNALPASALIIATGRFPEMIFVRSDGDQDQDQDQKDEDKTVEVEPQLLRWEGINPYKEPAFRTQVGLFADGDVFTDYSAAIKAIGAGRRAAASVHEIMYDISLDLPENVAAPEAPVQNVDHVEKVSASTRNIMPVSARRDLAEGGELESGFDETAARQEADRCLQCGLICYLQSDSESKKAS